MKIIFLSLLFFISFLLNPQKILAESSSFVSVVNPVRGSDFWDIENQDPKTVVLGQINILEKYLIRPTWLLRFDALENLELVNLIKDQPSHEVGLFLEITPSWTDKANVVYNQSEDWHFAKSVLLTGYEPDQREKLIDTAFEKFKEVFGKFPTSVGAWWIDAYSLDFMQKKYGIVSAMIVADQYTTDNYQIWGQFWSTPYYPSKNHALQPSQSMEDKLPIVVVQWAARDPVNGYGKGVEDSTFSMQPNDYIDYHDLSASYFSKLVDIYTKQKFNKFGHLIVGLENTYSWDKYSDEYENQMRILKEKSDSGQFSLVTMSGFANWYQSNFQISPEQIIEASDPLGTNKRVVWFMSPYYRAGWFFNQDGSVFRDIRQYVGGNKELCFDKSCETVNFATSAVRVLDEVSFGHKWIIDDGEISNLKIEKMDDKVVLTYLNQAGNDRVIEFLPRDISVDGEISSIDTAILEATKHNLDQKNQAQIVSGLFNWTLQSVIFKIFKFTLFILIAFFVPGFLIIQKLKRENSFYQITFLGIVLGLSFFSLIFYFISLINLKQLIYLYLSINLILFIKNFKQFLKIPVNINRFNLIIIFLIMVGVVFQIIPTFKNGLTYSYGMGLWGPNTHDGMWHISLINQLVKHVPPENPIFGGEILKNYHYFYDLTIAATIYVTGISVIDLIFRFYPILLSSLLGLGSFYLIKGLINIKENLQSKLSIIAGLYLVYFSGSFGWIVSYIREKNFSGESHFWANQSISFNLNPPFAISLIIVIAILQLLDLNKLSKLKVAVLTILIGPLIAFKAYAAILILASFFLVGLIKKSINYLVIFIASSVLTTFLFLSNFSLNNKIMLFSPFWFIHSMIDSPDRVGWIRLTLAREDGLTKGNWLKFLSVEAISLIIFIVGNLGVRVFALLSLIKFPYIVRRADYLFIFIFSSLAFFIPILFIQAGNPWNTIQFLYYFLYVSAVVGGVVIAKVVVNLPKMIGVPILLFFIALTPINSWATANSYLTNQPHGFISNGELEALKFLKSQKDGIVLTYPYDGRLKNKFMEPWPIIIYDSTAYVSALTEKSVYIEDEQQNNILLTDYKKRLVASKDFYANFKEYGDKFISENNIKYIYLPKIHNLRLDENVLNISNIFENKEVVIYKINK
ncbi:MAG: hypothetical protein Q8P92_01730 [Candidatus Daviesbacteria bacterium]|nr:hypothetical protein [Candidatus Daviesbacteria bacterium]